MKQNPKAWAAMATTAALVAALMAGCTPATANSTSTSGYTSASTPAATGGDTQTISSSSEKVKDEDLDASWDEASATKITLDGSNITVDGDGAKADGSTVTITAAGTYLLRGSLNDGQVVVDAPEDALVRIVLDGVTLHCETSAPINCEQADKLLLILAEGSQNEVTDGDSYTFPDAATDEPSAAIFSKADLTINGSGLLNVTASYNNGIGTKDDLILVSGGITVKAANHAIRGRDSVTVLEAALTLDAGKDGIQANNTKADDKGWIELYGGSYDITAAGDGIQAETYLTIAGGEYTITTGGGSENAAERAEEAFGPGGGAMPGGGAFTPPTDGAMPQDGEMPTPPDGWGENGGMPTPPGDGGQDTQTTEATGLATTETSALAADTTAVEDASSGSTSSDTADSAESSVSDSFKGLKAGGDLTVTGGSFAIDSADDTIHSNANITLSGGTYTLKSGDDGVHADTNLLVDGDTDITITESYEGLEGATVTIKGGKADINASDDGINAAGGNDSASTGGMFGGQDSFTATEGLYIRIDGGEIDVTSGYDGLDSNGTIEINGGTVRISGPLQGGGEGAIDCDGDVTVNGGTITAAATQGFAVMGAASSTINNAGGQPVLVFQFDSSQSAGTTVELKDDAGNTLASYAPGKDFSQIVFSADGMKDGGTYTVYADGEKAGEVTLVGSYTAVDSAGNAIQNQMGGGGGGFPGGRGQNG